MFYFETSLHFFLVFKLGISNCFSHSEFQSRFVNINLKKVWNEVFIWTFNSFFFFFQNHANQFDSKSVSSNWRFVHFFFGETFVQCFSFPDLKISIDDTVDCGRIIWLDDINESNDLCTLLKCMFVWKLHVFYLNGNFSLEISIDENHIDIAGNKINTPEYYKDFAELRKPYMSHGLFVFRSMKRFPNRFYGKVLCLNCKDYIKDKKFFKHSRICKLYKWLTDEWM